MNIVIPIAGYGTRFAQKGYETFKPFIRVKGIPLLEYAISSLKLKGTYHIITRPLEQHYMDEIREIFDRYGVHGHILTIFNPTQGAAETCLFAERIVPNNQPLVITNCDQYSPWNPVPFETLIDREDVDAAVTTFDHGDIVVGKDSPYSFVELNEKGEAVRFAEKLAISEHALNGIHYWKRAQDFFDSARELLADNSVQQEKYVSLTFNYMLKGGKKILTHRMQPGEFYALGTPAEVEKNLSHL